MTGAGFLHGGHAPVGCWKTLQTSAATVEVTAQGWRSSSSSPERGERKRAAVALAWSRQIIGSNAISCGLIDLCAGSPRESENEAKAGGVFVPGGGAFWLVEHCKNRILFSLRGC